MINIKKRILFVLACLLFEFAKANYPHNIELTTPINEATEVTTPSVILSWIVSPNVSSTNNISYKLNVVEMYPNVSIPSDLDLFCSSCYTTNINIQYSFQSELGTYSINVNECKTYAWQVTLIENIPGGQNQDGTPMPGMQNILGKSEVYSFTTTCSPQSNPPIPIDLNYMTFPPTVNNYVYEIERKYSNNSKIIIPYKYESFYNQVTADTKASLKILDESWLPIETAQIEFKKGLNYIAYECSVHLLNNKIYFLQIIDAKDNMKTLKFRLR